ncbi:MAG: hypothetical protein Q9225_002648 [Loekoesia sp. 1 TL-2023]
MPNYMRGGHIDARDCNWLGFRLRDALEPHIDQIITNSQSNVGDWEAWVQSKLMNALERMCDDAARNATDTGLHGLVHSEFVHEDTYQTSKQRSDLIIRVSICDPDPECLPEDPQSWEEPTEFYAVELKYKSTQEPNSSFVDRVKMDIEKVLNRDWHQLLSSEHAASAWVIAISLGDSQLEEMMYKAAEEKGIEWQVIELSETGGIKIWTYEHYVKGVVNQVLFSYASQKSLTIYQRGGGRPTEPVMHPDDCICDSCAYAAYLKEKEKLDDLTQNQNQ